MEHFTEQQLLRMSPAEFRSIVRKAQWTERTPDVSQGYGYANLVILPKEYTFDFLLFCNRNPQPCPIIEITEPGDPEPKRVAPGADLRTDFPRYHVYSNGEIIDEPTDILSYWQDDFVSFLMGCSRGFKWALQEANVSFRMYRDHQSTIPCIPAGCFSGHMVVTVWAFKNSKDAIRAIQISSRHPYMHGPPVHIGSPAEIGVRLDQPDRLRPQKGSVQAIRPGEVVMAWGCGVTPQAVALESKLPFMITHAPGHLFVTDFLAEELAVL